MYVPPLARSRCLSYSFYIARTSSIFSTSFRRMRPCTMQCFTPSWASALITRLTHSNHPHQTLPPYRHMQHILEQQPKANLMPISIQSGQPTSTYPTAFSTRLSRSSSTRPLALAQRESTPHVMRLYPASLLSTPSSKAWIRMRSRIPQLPLEPEMRRRGSGSTGWPTSTCGSRREHLSDARRRYLMIRTTVCFGLKGMERTGSRTLVCFLFFRSHSTLIFPDGFLQPNYLQTRSSKWPSNLHGTKPGASSQRPTKRS